MKTLTIDQQNLIIAEIARYNIRFNNIKDELTDHIFCEIEELCNTEHSFEQAFIIVFDKWHILLNPRKDLKYKNVPSFISNTWYNSDDNRWRIAGCITMLFFILNLVILKLDNITQTVSFLSISFIGFVLSILLLIKNRKRHNYRASFLNLKATISGSILLLFTLILGLKAYRLINNDFNIGNFDILSLIAFYHFINITLLLRENNKYRVKQLA